MIPCCWPISSNGCYSWTVSAIIPVSLPQVLSMAKQTWPKVKQNAAASQMHEWVNRITSRWPVAFIFPGLDQPLFALMRTVVTYNSFLWRAKVQLCCLSEDHHGSNSKAKAALGEQEFTRDGKQPVWKAVLVKGQKVIGFFCSHLRPAHGEAKCSKATWVLTPVLLGSSTGHMPSPNFPNRGHYF